MPPTYESAAERILAYVRRERPVPQSRLPSEREFEKLLGVSRPTVNKAIACLIAQGHLRREGYKLLTATIAPATAMPAVHVLHPHPQSQESAFIRERLIEAAHDVASQFSTHAIPILAHTASEQLRQLHELLEKGTCGFVLWPMPGLEARSLLKRAADSGACFVVCDQDLGHRFFVRSDNEAAAAQAVKHLHENGHRQIAYITQSLRIGSLRERYEGYRRACGDLGVRPAVIEVETASIEDAATAWKQLRSRYPKAAAVFCSNDLLAIRLMENARRARVEVPAQLSVVGFDDIEAASLASPSLTTLRQDFYQLGIVATQLLYQQLRQRVISPLAGPVRVRIEPELVVRKSVSPLS